MTGVPGSGTILSHIESTGEMCIIMVWQKVKRGESLFAVLSNKTGRTHLENETGMFMRKKHMKAIALGMAAREFRLPLLHSSSTVSNAVYGLSP